MRKASAPAAWSAAIISGELLAGPSVGRPCPEPEALRRAFRLQEARTQRRTDGTVSIEGVRFEVLQYGQCYLGHALQVIVGMQQRGMVAESVAYSLDTEPDLSALVHGVSRDIENAAQRPLTHGHLNGSSGVLHLRATCQTVRRIHGNAARGVLTQVLRHFHREVVRFIPQRGVGQFQRGVDLRQTARWKFHVNNGTQYLRHSTHTLNSRAHVIFRHSKNKG